MRLIQKGGNDVVMTPPDLAQRIVDRLLPNGGQVCLDPCKGDGAFYNAMKSIEGNVVHWDEITQGRDFLQRTEPIRFDIICSNPPWSEFRAFNQKAMEIADDIIWLTPVNSWWYTARQRDMAERGFGMVEILKIPKDMIPPKPWPSSGFQIAAVHIRKFWADDCKISELEP